MGQAAFDGLGQEPSQLVGRRKRDRIGDRRGRPGQPFAGGAPRWSRATLGNEAVNLPVRSGKATLA